MHSSQNYKMLCKLYPSEQRLLAEIGLGHVERDLYQTVCSNLCVMNQGKRFYELDTAQDTDQKCWERYAAAATRTDRVAEHMESAGSTIQVVLDKLRPDEAT